MEKKQQDELLEVLQEYNAKLSQVEHENIMLRVENKRLRQEIQDQAIKEVKKKE